MEPIVAYCGLLCSDCPAFIATQANDDAGLERVAAQWRIEFNAPDITAEWARCDGCLTSARRKCGHCCECEIRACALARGVVNCAYCADYTCAALEGFYGFVPDARARLDAIRAGLAG